MSEASSSGVRRWRILHVVDFYRPFIGGMERHVEHLAAEQVRQGHDVRIATLALPGVTPDDDGAADVARLASTSARLLARGYADQAKPYHPPAPDPQLVRGLRREIRDFQPTVIHTHGWITYSVLAARPPRTASVIVTLHDYGIACVRKTNAFHDAGPCPGRRLDRCLSCAPEQYGTARATALTGALFAMKPLEGRVDGWVAVSEAVAIASRRGLPRGAKVDIIPSFIAPEETGQERPDWLPADDGYLMFVGALGRHKGLLWLLDAYEQLPAGKPPLVVIGTPQIDTPTSFPDGVIVRTDVPHAQVTAAWRGASIGLVPSLWQEPFGQVAVEAMRAGAPVIATDTGGLSDVVDDGVTGLLVPPGDSPALVAALRRLIDDAPLRSRLGAAGRDRAARFTVAPVFEQYLSLYDRLAGRR